MIDRDPDQIPIPGIQSWDRDPGREKAGIETESRDLGKTINTESITILSVSALGQYFVFLLWKYSGSNQTVHVLPQCCQNTVGTSREVVLVLKAAQVSFTFRRNALRTR